MTIEIDPTAKISRLCDIEDSVRGSRIIIGRETVIDSFVKVKPAGGSGDLAIGARSKIGAGVVFYTGNGVRIGNDTSVAPNVVFAPTNHAYEDKDKLIHDQRFLPSRGGIVIEDDCWIGAGTVLLDGAILRRGCVVLEMSLVRSELPAYSIHAGNPLKLIGWRK